MILKKIKPFISKWVENATSGSNHPNQLQPELEKGSYSLSICHAINLSYNKTIMRSLSHIWPLSVKRKRFFKSVSQYTNISCENPTSKLAIEARTI